MFDQPEAKRVRRSDLLDTYSQRSSSPITDAAAEQELYSKQQLHFDLDFVDIKHDADPPPQNPEAEKAQPFSALTHPVAATDDGPSGAIEFEFRLFSTSTGTSTGTRPRAHEGSTRTNDAAPSHTPPPTTPSSSRNPKSGIHRIRIRSPTPLCSPTSSGDGAFVVPHRPRAYYFTHPATAADQRAAYTAVAVSSVEVRERADKTRWPGTSLPWRVTHVHLPRHSTSPSQLQLKRAPPPPTLEPQPPPQPPSHPAETAIKTKFKTRRTRAGKKRRLAIRARYVATTAQAETERAKRTRRNREKKVKRKEREKRAKEQEQAGSGD